MADTISLEFDLQDEGHRLVAEWLEAQVDPAGAVVRLVMGALEGSRRLQQWEESASLLAEEVRTVRAYLLGSPSGELDEDPESARRLDSMFDE